MDQHQLKMSFLAQTTDVNYHGNVHGGKVMKWIDEVAYALPFVTHAKTVLLNLWMTLNF